MIEFEDEVPDNVRTYLNEISAGDRTLLENIGSGNLNNLVLVRRSHLGPVVVKWPRSSTSLGNVPKARVQLEATALKVFERSRALRVPKLLFSSTCGNFFVRQYLDESKQWQDLTINQQIGIFHANILEFVLECLSSQFEFPVDEGNLIVSSKMNSIIKKVTFLQPIQQTFSTFRTNLDAQQYQELQRLQQSLVRDKRIQSAFSHALKAYCQKENPMHGDLHLDSIVLQDDNVAVIDLEFSSMGNCAFDAGVFLAHMLLSHEPKRKCTECLEIDCSDFLELTHPEFSNPNLFLKFDTQFWYEVRLFVIVELVAKICGPIESRWLAKDRGESLLVRIKELTELVKRLASLA